ncbi:MAG: bacillithiol system redox-active protein YtxJ [Pyrinomonadaceae bacterium]
MKDKFSAVTSVETLEQLAADSQSRPVVIFKHSTTCPISSAAYREMSQVKDSVSMIIVQQSRGVSREVEARTGVRHESPQAIILRNGKAVWSASHYDITADGVERALSEHS